MGFDINQKQEMFLSIRSEEVQLFLVLLIYIKTHNRREINS